MKTRLRHIWFCFALIVCSVQLFAQDTPPAVPNMQSFAAGSYVIPMDNDKQALNGEPFNLSSYGLIYALLDQGIPLHWVIKSGKGKDEIDFTASASRVYPSPTNSAVLDFRGSAFIIDATDVQAQVSCGGITSSAVDQTVLAFGYDVSVYRLDQSATVDVRYTLTNTPVIAVLTDGSAEETEEHVLDYAHVPYAAIDYATFSANSTCYTFIAQPHLSNSTGSGGGNLDIATYTSIITTFLNNGGNFFAQCASIPTFENEANFLTTNGVNNFGVTNSPPDQPLGGNLNYDNNDLPVMQFDGPTIGYEVGSTYHFALNGGSFENFAYSGIWKDYNGNPSYLVAAGDLNGAALGGNVFYLAGHDYTPNTTIQPSGNNGTQFQSDVIESYNLNRVALNAAFIPASWVATCVGADRCICPGQSVNIGCSDVANTQYTWTPATGLSCTDCPNPVATPSVTTTYTATGPGGCSANSVTVIIDCPIVVASQDTICEGNCATITIDAQITNTPVTLLIDGVSQTYASTITSLCPTTTTTYNFEVVDDQGISYTDDVTVDVYPQQMVTIESSNEICSGETITFTAPNVINPVWSTTESLSCTSCASPTLVLVDDFTIEVDGEDANGCSVNDDFALTVYEIPVVVLTVPEGPSCVGTTITLSASGADNFLWPSTGETTSTIDYDLQATATVSVTGTSVEGCTSTDEEEVVVNPIIPIVIEDQVFMCITDSCITLNAVNVSSVQWMLTDGTLLSTEMNFQVCPTAPTTYVAQTDNPGCYDPDDVLVDIVLVPEVTARPDTTVCPGQPVRLYATGADSYTWRDQMGNVLETMAPVVSTLFSQSYSVEGTSVEGCNSDDHVVVSVFPTPMAEFETTAPDGFFSLLPIYFNSTSIGAECYVWDIYDYPHYGGTDDHITHTFGDPGQYQVDLKVCNELGCWDSVTHYVDLGSEFYFYVPSAFTPNPTDDINSFFKVYGTNISELGFELNIFNRWGELINSLHHPDEVWLGNHMKDESYFLPDGVYNWQLHLRDKYTLKNYEAQGHVIIFR